jgi:hypothetical protein
MTYNIHPLFVHFPIALLFIYSLIKILPLRKLFPKVSWKHIELLLLLLGVLGAFAAIYTGGIARHLVNPSNKHLVQMHSLFASISTWFFGALLFGELLSFLNPLIKAKSKLTQLNDLLLFIEKILTNPLLSKGLAFLGLIAISVTGLLGGVMVYGLSADPIAPLILKLLNINL